MIQQLFSMVTEPGHTAFQFVGCLAIHTAYFQFTRMVSPAIRNDRKRLSWVLTWISSIVMSVSSLWIILSQTRTVFHRPIPYELYDQVDPITGLVKYQRLDVAFPPPAWIKWPVLDAELACRSIYGLIDSDIVFLGNNVQNCTLAQEKEAFYRYIDKTLYATTPYAVTALPRWSFARVFSWFSIPPHLIFDFRFKPEASALAEWTMMFFGTYMIADLAIGSIYYAEKITLVTGWCHHAVFIAAALGSMFVDTTAINALCVAEEFPTAIVSTGFMFKRLRNDMLFGAVFVLMRLVYDILFSHEILRNWTQMGAPWKAFILIKTAFNFKYFQGWVVQQIALRTRERKAREEKKKPLEKRKPFEDSKIKILGGAKKRSSARPVLAEI
ncbi:hypothetical protein BGZ82_005010 [Podila clonocystis]|nr:hypothetical protein BGZ82_005010 [Podila clonocystis]